MTSWGWRIPFLLGFLLAPIGIYLRSGSPTPGFRPHDRSQGSASTPVGDAVTIYNRPVLAAFGLSVIGTVGNYTFNISCRPTRQGQLGIVRARPIPRP